MMKILKNYYTAIGFLVLSFVWVILLGPMLLSGGTVEMITWWWTSTFH